MSGYIVTGNQRKAINKLYATDGDMRKAVNKAYVVTGGQRKLWYSGGDSFETPGWVWNNTAIPAPPLVYGRYAYVGSLAFGNGRFVGSRDDGESPVVSIDGIHWTAGIRFSWYDRPNDTPRIVFYKGYFYIYTSGIDTSNYTDLYFQSRSADGITWEDVTNSPMVAGDAFICGDTMYVCSTIAVSRHNDASGVFSLVFSASSTMYNHVMTNINGTYLLFFSNASGIYVVRSADGVSWGTPELIESGSYNQFDYGRGACATAPDGRTVVRFTNTSGVERLLYTPDGVTFTGMFYTKAKRITGLAYGNGKFMMSVTSGTPGYSVDGLTWIDLPTTPEAGAIVFGDGIFISAGYAATPTTAGYSK